MMLEGLDWAPPISPLMKKSIVFVLFCVVGFCLGYAMGVPFFKSALKEAATPSSGDEQPLEERRREFVSLAAERNEPKEVPEKTKARLPAAAAQSNRAKKIENLSLAEVQSRLEQMNGMLATSTTDELEQSLVTRWANLDPIGATEYAADAVAQGGSPRLLQTAAKAWAKYDPASASQWAAGLDSPIARDTALGQIFSTWSETNPSQAAGAIDYLPIGSAQTVATSAVAKNFVRGNLNAALQWAEGLSGPVQRAATREIVNLWSISDPQAAGDWIMQRAAPQLRGEALGQLAGSWVAHDPGAAIGYAQTISNAELRAGFIKSAMNRFASMDPIAAADWLSSDASKPYASSLVGGVSSRWADFDPNSAAGWASSITDTKLRNQALAAVSTSWGKNSPDAAAQWIGSLRDTQAKDVATAAFSVELAKANPAMAAQWASRISDPGKLANSLNQIVRNWKKIDPNAARSFVLSSTTMPADLRQKLLR